MSANLQSPVGRLAALDVLRGVAVLLVLGRHWPFVATPESPWFIQLLPLWTRAGWIGVDLFFVLSGFLVGGLLFAEFRRTGRLNMGRFYIRRGFKIYPAFYVLVVAGFVLANRPEVKTSLPNILREVCFLQNYSRGMWMHTWSLAVEEHFYLMLPLFLHWLLRPEPCSNRCQWRLVGSILIVCILVPVMRILAVGSHVEFREFGQMFPTHLRIDSLFWGVLLAYLYHFHGALFLLVCSRYQCWLLAGGVLALLPAMVFDLGTSPWIWTWGFTLFALGSAALLMGSLACSGSLSLPCRWLSGIGVYSYSIYLWHIPVKFAVLDSLTGIWGDGVVNAAFVLYLLGSIALGIQMSRCIELPMLKLRDRLTANQSNPVSGGVAVPA